MNAKLTKRSIDAMPCPGRTVTVWDKEISGFGLRLTPGGAKSYVLKYRVGSRQRWYTIGKHGSPWTPDAARKQARQLIAKAALGDDPAAERAAQRQMPTLSRALDRYVVQHVAHHNRPRTQREVRRIVENKIKPGLGDRGVADVTRAEVKAWHQAMCRTPREANHALAILSKCLSLCVGDWGLIDQNPCFGINRFPEKSRERYLSVEELRRLGRALIDAETRELECRGVIDAVWLLSLTGCRRSEILELKWEQVDMNIRTIRLSDSKAGPRTVPLGTGALAHFQTMLGRRSEDCGFVIRGPDGGRPLSPNTLQGAWRRICLRARLKDVRLHDLRHTAGTFGAQSGANAFEIRDFLGHRTLSMTNRYVARALNTARPIADNVSNRVREAMLGQDMNVVPLTRLDNS